MYIDKFKLVFTNHLKKFNYIKNLGDGAYGYIYLYSCNHFNFKKLSNCKQIFAVKKIKINESKIKNKVLLKSMLNEWTFSRILQHSNIRHVIDIDLTNNCLIYDYNKEYIDLFDHVTKDLFIKNEINLDKFIYQFQSLLSYIHKLGVAHMDIKLENILIDNNYNIKLIDFGNAHVFKYNNSYLYFRGLRTTYEYASPEQFMYENYLPFKSDLWSFGVVLLSIFLNDIPWERANRTDINYVNFLKNKKLFFEKNNIEIKYQYLLYNLLSIKSDFRVFSFKSHLQNTHLLHYDNFFDP